ncbi:expressed unknown protein [Seminavis robusta]|uniref:DUF6824 domain-containing protein n=1 Tax=Seminavis robusta TaxID=568900 RepID=A0A9N8DAJ3_9STRA|nr:expressed unknown protein [Seminavis robusta]|eukprot:Sro2_g001350.1 n/a (567) ;mRNA; r:124939-126639
MADNGLGYITELNAMDVLFGRGSGPNDHEGNIRFRHLVAERKQEYLATNHRQTKAKIAREIVNKILDDRGRFLKKVEHFEARRLGIPKGVDAWIIVDDDTVMEKAKQALRQNTAKEKRGASPTRGGASSPLRGNSPVRGVSPSRSPIPGTSPVPVRRQQQPMPTFEDLEPLPLGMNNANLAAARAAGGPFAGMSLQEQQQRIQQQVQQQVQQQAQQQLQQQVQQQQITAAAQLAALGGVPGVDPTSLAWGGSDHNRFVAAQNVAQMAGGGAGDWGRGGSNHGHGGIILPGQDAIVSNNAQLAGAGGWQQQQQQQQAADALNNMAPPNPSMLGPGQVQYSNDNNWGGNSEHTIPSGSANRGDRLPGESMEDSRKRRQSLQVEDLMDSFSKLQTGNFSAEAKLQESTDTMGTIEPIGAYDSTSMSVTSFSSSSFSLFKNAMGESTDDMAFSRGVSRSSSINEGARVDIDSSMQSMQSIGSLGNMSEVWGTRGMSLLDRLVAEERERAAGGGEEGGDGGGAAGGIADDPRPVGLMEDQPDTLQNLGASSMSVMKAAFDSNRPGDNGNAD